MLTLRLFGFTYGNCCEAYLTRGERVQGRKDPRSVHMTQISFSGSHLLSGERKCNWPHFPLEREEDFLNTDSSSLSTLPGIHSSAGSFPIYKRLDNEFCRTEGRKYLDKSGRAAWCGRDLGPEGFYLTVVPEPRRIP